jgi:regulator of replication initiation timing
MGKRVVDEELRFSIIINGDTAQKELQGLDSQTRKLTSTNKTLRLERDKLRAQGKQNTAGYKKLSASIKENNSVINANKARMLKCFIEPPCEYNALLTGKLGAQRVIFPSAATCVRPAWA